MELRFTVSVKIQKPLEAVFDGVYNPQKLSQYFTTAG
ncbi:MAG: ATPase, partial [Thermoanaerobaculia bacterium]